MSSPFDPSSNINLEQQSKRAKDLRRAHRDGSIEAAVRIARYLPKACNQSPEQVLAGKLTLSEAQFVIAREAGFSSWPSMRHYVEQRALTTADVNERILEDALAGKDVAVHGAPGSIHVAAALGDVDAAIRFLQAAPSSVDRRGGQRQWTPLLYLCASRFRRSDPGHESNRIRIARRLLEFGADVNAGGAEIGFTSWNSTLFDQENWHPIDAAAVHRGSWELVQLLLNAGADLNKTPAVLSQAVRSGNPDVLQILLASLPEPLRWQVGWAAKASVLLNRIDMVRMLASYNAPRILEQALLDAIRLERNPEMIEVLAGGDSTDPSAPSVWSKAYRAAIRFDQREAAEMLHHLGIDDTVLTDVDRVIASCMCGEAPLLDVKSELQEDDHRMLAWAVRTGRYHAVPLLLSAGVDPNVPDRDGETPLHLAVRADAPETVAVLLKAGASVEIRNFDSERTLDVALSLDKRRGKQIVKQLLQAGAKAADDVLQLERAEMNLLFERAADAVVFGDIETLRQFLDEEPSLVHARSPRPHRATLLNYCGSNGVEEPRQRVAKNAAEIVKLLLDRGSDVNATCNLYGGGATTLGLHITSIYPFRAGTRTAVTEILINAGAMVDGAHGTDGIVGAAAVGRLDLVVRFSNATPAQLQNGFMWACEYGRTGVVSFLLEKGVDFRAKNGNGLTPVHLASLGGHLETVRILLERGAPLEVRNIWGGTVLANTLWGAINGGPDVDYTPVVEALLRAGAKVATGHLDWWSEQNPAFPGSKERIQQLLQQFVA
jgi:ankyrin repeat protein